MLGWLCIALGLALLLVVLVAYLEMRAERRRAFESFQRRHPWSRDV